MTILFVDCQNLTTVELDKIFGDWLGAIEHQKTEALPIRMTAVRRKGEIAYIPAQKEETFTERILDDERLRRIK